MKRTLRTAIRKIINIVTGGYLSQIDRRTRQIESQVSDLRAALNSIYIQHDAEQEKQLSAFLEKCT